MKTTILLCTALAPALLCASACMAQAYPSKMIRIVIGFPPGGGVDINARLLAPKLQEALKQQVIVDNRPGAGTNIANELVAKSAPDGYTLLMNTAAVVINMSLYKKVNYDALRDFAPVSLFSEAPNILVVHSSVPAKSVKELLDLARKKPGSLNYSSAGSGTTQHLAGELFKLRTRTDIVHVPYKGSAPSLTALIGGEVTLSFANIPAIQSHVNSGRLRALATLGRSTAKQMPAVPTMKDAGVPGVEVVVWYGVLAPAATPRPILDKLSEAVMGAAKAPDLRQRLIDQGADPVGSTAEQFGKLLKEEVVKWAEVVKISGAKAD